MMHRRAGQRGVSLIEAVVAMGVMAFGILAVVGVQATLRGSGDLARQRTEAMRIAQEQMEEYRGYAALEAGASGGVDFEEIDPDPRTAVDTSGMALDGRLNTTFYATVTAPTYANSAAMKPVAVTVDWTDRSGLFQSVELRSVIAGVPQGMSGSLALPPARQPFAAPRGRHRSVPVAAFSLPVASRSVFKPPQGAGGSIAWVFNNVTGLVVGICNVSASITNANITESEAEGCVSSASATSAQLLSGYVRFANGDPSEGTEAEDPTGSSLNLDIALALTSSHPATQACVDDASSNAVEAGARREVTYYCLIYSNDAGTWAGRARVSPQAFSVGSPWVIASSGSTAFKVCRYTPLAADSGTRNVDHPLDYTEAGSSRGTGLANQNFLVISAGFGCPTESVTTGDLLNANTRLHQDGVSPYTNP